MPRFVVVIPPSPFLSSERVFPALGPVQIATAARDLAGWRVRVLDLTAADDADSLIAAQHADVYGVYAQSCHLPAARAILASIRGHWPKALAILGGPHAAMDPESAARIGFDHVVSDLGGGGGGEAPFLRLLGRWRTGLSTPQIVRAGIDDADLHRWPWPDRSLLDFGSYDYRIGGRRATSIVTQRGCPYGCTFCSHTETYRRVQYRDPDHVAAELRDIRSRFGVDAVMVYDDEVNLSSRHFASLCGVLRSGGWVWRAFCRSNLLTPDQADLAAASGAVALCAGVETVDPETKRLIHKRSTVEDDTRFVRECLRVGIAPKTFTMIGMPGESEATVNALRRWLIDRVGEGLRDFDVTILQPYPGTRIYADLVRTGSHVAGPHHGLRIAPGVVLDGAAAYKTRPGSYSAVCESFDPATGRTILSVDRLCALREEVDSCVRAAIARVG